MLFLLLLLLYSCCYCCCIVVDAIQYNVVVAAFILFTVQCDGGVKEEQGGLC